MLLCILVEEEQATWDKHLQEVVMANCDSTLESTRYRPLRLMFGRNVRLPVEVMFCRGPEPVVEPQIMLPSYGGS